MEKIVKYIKKKDNLFCFIIFFVLILGRMYIYPLLASYDYILNFQSIYKMYNGCNIYKDINVIVTPLFFYLGVILLKIMGPNCNTYNIYGAMINALMINYIYKILKNLKCTKKITFIITFGIYTVIEKVLIANGANYNFLALLFVLIGINTEIKDNTNKETYTNYLQGLITFFILFTKQNIGVYYLIAITIYEFLKEKSIVVAIKACIKQYLAIGILGILFLVYLKISNIWDYFFYYVVSGIGDFTNNIAIPKMSNSDVFFFMIPIIVSILGFVGIKKNLFIEQDKKNLKLLICVSIASLGYVIPLCNNCHIYMFAIVNIITIVYLIRLIFKIDLSNSKKIERFIFIILILVNICYLIETIYISSKVNIMYITDTTSPFYLNAIPKEVYNETTEAISYIRKKQDNNVNVIIIDQLSGLYMIPLKKNNGKFDCVNRGNLGKDGVKGVIDEIEKMHNTEILIPTDDNVVFWQEPKELRKYIKENLEYKGEIKHFSIYSKN